LKLGVLDVRVGVGMGVRFGCRCRVGVPVESSSSRSEIPSSHATSTSTERATPPAVLEAAAASGVLAAVSGATTAESAVALAMGWLRAVLVRPSGVEEEACRDASVDGSGGVRSSGSSSAAASMA
jgi:hypothetical protein